MLQDEAPAHRDDLEPRHRPRGARQARRAAGDRRRRLITGRAIVRNAEEAGDHVPLFVQAVQIAHRPYRQNHHLNFRGTTPSATASASSPSSSSNTLSMTVL